MSAIFRTAHIESTLQLFYTQQAKSAASGHVKDKKGLCKEPFFLFVVLKAA